VRIGRITVMGRPGRSIRLQPPLRPTAPLWHVSLRCLLTSALVGVAALAVLPGRAGAQAAAPPPAPVPVPGDSGTGRRVVYDMGTMHVWLIEADGSVVRDYPVSGHKFRKLPGTGAFWVYSRSRYTGVANSPTRMEFMVRFARGNTGTAIGFHSIPTKHGKPIQAVGQLGTPFSHGCVRQSNENAQFLFDWAPEGTAVNVVDTTGRVPAAKPNAFPRGLRPMTPMERLMTMPLLLKGVVTQ
jgi:hypothetical protein